MNHSHDTTGRPQIDGRFKFALLGLLVVAAFYLLSEHRAHALGVLPFAILLLCPLLHVLMHRNHAAHHHRERPDSANLEGRWRDD